NGSGDDSDGHIAGYKWTQTSGTAVTLSNSNRASTSFTAPNTKQIERLGFRLTVTDNESEIHSDEIFITVNPVNTLPTALITSPTPVAENTFTRLDGSGSNDTDGSIASYHWTQVAGPVVALFNAGSANPSFSTPSVYQDTTLSFRLDVLDDEGGAASAIAHLTVLDVNTDDDSDGLLDTWEMLFFNTLTHDGTTDTDSDGATDQQEFDFGTNPTTEQQPAQPEIVSPDATEVASLFPELSLINPNQHSGFPVSYEFEVYSDATMSQLVTSTANNGLNWQVRAELADNTRYYWRARAIGATLFSDWVNSSFFVNTTNDAPGTFNISYPQDGVWVASFTPTLSVTNSTDIDGDALSYRFEVYADSTLIATSSDLPAGRNGTTSWTLNTPLLENNLYYWRAVVTDEHGLSTSSSEPMIFINTVNDAPTTPTLAAPLNDSEITSLYADLIINNSSDPEGEAVYYLFELDGVNTFDSSNKQSSDVISETPINTSWSINGLQDNTWYYWRTKASDGLTESLWSNGRFFVNQFNDAPGIPTALNPGDHGWTGSLQPTLELHPATDIDGDALSYEFAIYKAAEAGLEPELVSTGISSNTFWQADAALPGAGNYYWHARAIDEHNLAGDWGELVTFFADDDGINDTPVIQLKNIKQEHDANDETSQVEIKWTDYDPDSDARISLYYDTDQHGEDGVLIAQDISEDPDADYDSFNWDINQIPAGVYFIYAMIDDGYTTSVSYSSNAVIVGDGGGQPYLVFKTAENENQGKRNQRTLIQWRDLDSDSNAIIDLYYDSDNAGFDGRLITTGIEEDTDGNADHFLWDTSAMAEGDYYIYAIISDQTNHYQVYSDNAITIKHGKDKH
ncbi:MAG: PKD domain-containing protein, partial [Gammaproteobacteria bacterium]|nr:PKD domain-containing protein [Gammaproteobacteria bacterium]